MSRVVSIALTVQVNANVNLPSWIHLTPERDGIDWYVRYNTLHYVEDNEWKEYDLGLLEYDGDYKRPEIEVTEEEKIEDETDEEDEEAAAEYEMEIQGEIHRGK
jgi:hypothetical protein